MRSLIVAGNWKMNASVKMTDALLSQLSNNAVQGVQQVVFPPAAYLSQAIKCLKDTAIKVGGQTCSEHEQGAYTGDISAAMLKDIGCEWALVGHSERRAYSLESDEQVLAKTQRLLEQSMTAVVCVGETLQERQQGQAFQQVKQQLKLLIEQLTENQWQRVVIAYEPVWAIGTGETASPVQAQEMHAFIRSELAAVSEQTAEQTHILYGGSVKAANAQELFAQPDIDGGLIGGASLDATEFLAISGS